MSELRQNTIAKALARSNDLLTQILGSEHPSDARIRAARPEIVSEITECYIALIDADDLDGGLSARERAAVAVRVAALHDNVALLSWFSEIAADLGEPPASLYRLQHGGTIVRGADPRIAIVVNYATQLTVEPAMVTDHRVLDLRLTLSEQEVVCLSELVSFLAYFVRVVTGLQLLRALEDA